MKHPPSELTGENPESGGDFAGFTEQDVDAELQSMGFRPAAADTPRLCLRVGGLRRQQQLPAFKAMALANRSRVSSLMFLFRPASSAW